MTQRPQELINDWYASIDLRQKAHVISSQKLDVFHYTIGISIILLSTVAVGIFLSGIESSNLRLTAGFLGLCAVVLSVIQTLYSHVKRSAMHQAAASQLGQLRSEIEELEKLPSKYLEAQAEIFVQVGQRLEKIEQTAPPLKNEVVRQLRARSQRSDILLKKMRQTAS